jgi:hypothetical protein
MTAEQVREFCGKYVISPDLDGIWVISRVTSLAATAYRLPEHTRMDLYLPYISKMVALPTAGRAMLLDFAEGKDGAIYFPRRRKARH